MNQIAIGSYIADGEWLVLHGEGIAAPFKKSVYQPVFEVGEEVNETIRVSLEGDPAALAGGISALETIRQRNLLYHQTGYPAPQCLRFQLQAGGSYFYSLLRAIELEANADAAETRLMGSLVLTLHITRPNYYDGEPVELPLTGHDVTDALGGVDLVNHTDNFSGPGNSVLINPEDFETDLPAPLRLELINTDEVGRLHDIFTGIYHHPENPPESLFFYYAIHFYGGLQLTTSAAINDNFTRVTWDETTWQPLGYWYLSNSTVEKLAGMWYRPIMRFFNTPAYEDLYLQIKVQVGSAIIWEAESIAVDPDYGYALFPPMQIPPNKLLNEVQPHHVHLMLYGQHDTAATYEVEFDCLTLLPLEPGANFLAFYDLTEQARLLDDNFLNQQVARFLAGGSEIMAHIRQGDRLTLFPGHYHRLILALTSDSLAMEKDRTANLRLYYRPRKRML
jgi:hypothetical protein